MSSKAESKMAPPSFSSSSTATIRWSLSADKDLLLESNLRLEGGLVLLSELLNDDFSMGVDGDLDSCLNFSDDMDLLRDNLRREGCLDKQALLLSLEDDLCSDDDDNDFLSACFFSFLAASANFSDLLRDNHRREGVWLLLL